MSRFFKLFGGEVGEVRGRRAVSEMTIRLQGRGKVHMHETIFAGKIA